MITPNHPSPHMAYDRVAPPPMSGPLVKFGFRKNLLGGMKPSMLQHLLFLSEI